MCLIQVCEDVICSAVKCMQINKIDSAALVRDTVHTRIADHRPVENALGTAAQKADSSVLMQRLVIA